MPRSSAVAVVGACLALAACDLVFPLRPPPMVIDPSAPMFESFEFADDPAFTAQQSSITAVIAGDPGEAIHCEITASAGVLDLPPDVAALDDTGHATITLSWVAPADFQVVGFNGRVAYNTARDRENVLERRDVNVDEHFGNISLLSNTTAMLGSDMIIAIPIMVGPADGKVIKLGIETHTSATVNVQLGLYSEKGNASPNLLLGSQVVTINDTRTEVDVDVPVMAGRYWIAVLSQTPLGLLVSTVPESPQATLVGHSFGAGLPTTMPVGGKDTSRYGLYATVAP